MPQYIDRDTGERVVIRHSRPSITLAVLFVFALGLIVWLMIPANPRMDQLQCAVNDHYTPTQGSCRFGFWRSK